MSDTPRTDAVEKAIDDFWNDPDAPHGFEEMLKEQDKRGIISPLKHARQLERELNEANNIFKFCEICNTPLSRSGNIGLDGIPTEDCLVCKLREQRNQWKEDAERLAKALKSISRFEATDSETQLPYCVEGTLAYQEALTAHENLMKGNKE